MALSDGGAYNPPKPLNRSATADHYSDHPSPNDAASLDVNPGTPRSPPPPFRHERDKPDSLETDETDPKNDTVTNERVREPRSTRFIRDPEGTLTHDETTVDVVTVPCPGGDALQSWNRDGLLGRYFGAPSMRDAEVERAGTGPSWVRQGIRREADVARILLYEHPPVEDGMTLGKLADALLKEMRVLRDEENGDEGISRQRPLVFIGHSIGGVVIKMALAKASLDGRYEDILRDCYGVVFFGESTKRITRAIYSDRRQELLIRDPATSPCPVWHPVSRTSFSSPHLFPHPSPMIYVWEIIRSSAQTRDSKP